MRALWRYDFLTTSQIGAEWWPGRHHSRPQIRLAELSASGLLARLRPLVPRGTHQWIYQLAREGFKTAQRCYGPDGPYIDEGVRWSERHTVDMRGVEHALRLNAWMLTYRHLLGGRLVDWLGRREANVSASASDGSEDDDSLAVTPDASALIELDPRAAPLELLVELMKDERPVRLADRIRRYGELVGSKWRSVQRFKTGERAPAILFVAASYRDTDRLLRTADTELSATGDDSAGEGAGMARERTLFCAEPDIQRGSLRAWVLPAAPPALRASDAFTAREVRLPG